ncbi:MAG TPA: M23 family metallopeptidase [Gemmatimonadales bacterium]|nr:M23 family metallopeptidase [Gemmatimonadales bacterium]
MKASRRLLSRTGACVSLALFGRAAASLAQVPAVVSLEPAEIRQGTVIRVTVEPRSAGAFAAFLVGGKLAGEPLHFEPVGGGAWSALAPVPVGAAAEIRGRIALIGARHSDTLSFVVPVADGKFAVDRELKVAPKFGRAPTSAEARRIAADNAKARAAGRAAHETPRLWREPFALPRPSRITARFGDGRVFNGQLQSRHLGTDFKGQVGEPIYAANRGVVVLATDFLLAGSVVYIDHGEGLTTGYFHMSQTLVNVGDTVQRGQLIGKVGNSGRVTGPHLHWVFRYGATNVDPLSLQALGLLVVPPSQAPDTGDSLKSAPTGRSP